MSPETRPASGVRRPALPESPADVRAPSMLTPCSSQLEWPSRLPRRGEPPSRGRSSGRTATPPLGIAGSTGGGCGPPQACGPCSATWPVVGVEHDVEPSRRRRRGGGAWRARTASTPPICRPSSSRRERRPRAAQGRGLGGRSRPAAHGARVADLAGSDRAASAIEAFTSVQVALSALDRLEVRGRDSAGLHVLVTDHGLDLDDPAIARLLDRGATRSSPQGGAHSPDGISASCTRPRPRSASSATTPRRCGADRATTTCLHLAVRSRDGRGGRPRAHPVGERRHHLRGQCAPAEPRRAADARRPVRHRRAERRRRQLRRSQGVERATFPAEITDRRQGHPGARVARLADGEALGRGVPVDGRRSRVRSRRRPVAACAPEQICSRSAAAARRCTSGLAEDVRRRERAVRRRRGGDLPPLDGETMPTRRPRHARARSSRSRGRRGRGHRAGLRRHAAAGGETRAAARRRSRPATSIAAMLPHFLLKEISEAPASFRKTLRGKIVDDGDGRLDGSPRSRDAAGPRSSSVARRDDPRRARDRPGHGRGRRAEPRSRAPPSLRASLAVSACRDRAVGLRLCATTCPTRSSSRSASRGTTTDTNRTVDLVRARGARHRDRQPPPERPRRQERRRAVHVRRPRRRDERRVDQGVLLADRGRVPARVRPGRRATSARRRTEARAAPGAARPARCGCEVLIAAGRSRARPAARAASALLGGRRQRRQPDRGARRCGSSCRSSATSRSPATSPRTRSTSTCRPSR